MNICTNCGPASGRQLQKNRSDVWYEPQKYRCPLVSSTHKKITKQFSNSHFRVFKDPSKIHPNKMLFGVFRLADFTSKIYLFLSGKNTSIQSSASEIGLHANFKKVACVAAAQARAIMVLPVPGGPCINTPWPVIEWWDGLLEPWRGG